ncbi:type II toxin-antitoxin system HicA family toxin [Deefgea salmonis]|uniref:Type II toxin-antitoxin system HicA family toxin n=1 Tax=Deefgea salmonis TaxID=2875502 RepID=A0ABS8BG85_9NEIS|nr:type II toxin-antitoxin system HicA family toxin [Deefgea salmonis]MCB5194719.1 type II toxin-antitoxin system HicA family toxin [Deefgea salmonis]
MSKAGKLLQRLKSLPRDFTWDDLKSVMSQHGFELHTGAGSARKFIYKKTNYPFAIHEPHPGSIMKPYALKAAVSALKDVGEID